VISVDILDRTILVFDSKTQNYLLISVESMEVLYESPQTLQETLHVAQKVYLFFV
jgi:hypothetical protein